MCWLRHWYTIEILDVPSGLVHVPPPLFIEDEDSNGAFGPYRATI